MSRVKIRTFKTAPAGQIKKLAITLFIIGFIATFRSQGAWSGRADFPGGPRYGGYSFALNGKGYYGGGLAPGTPTSQQFKDLWEYDPLNDSWTQKASHTASIGVFPAYAEVNGAGYLFGGKKGPGSSDKSFIRYDPPTDSWSQLQPAQVSYYGTSQFVIGDRIYITGGVNPYDDKDYDWMSEYNVTNGTWTVKISSSHEARYGSAFSLDGKGYFGFGYNKYYSTAFGYMFPYDPVSNTWGSSQFKPGAAVEGAASIACAGYGYIITGSNLDQVWMFDPVLKTWAAKAYLPGGGRKFSGSFCLNDKIYLVGGTNDSHFPWTGYSDLWEFTPDVNSGVMEYSGGEVRLFPIPASGYVTVQSPALIIECSLYDLAGSLLKQVRPSSMDMQVRLETPADGIYLVGILTSHGMTWKKLSVQNKTN